MNFTLNGAYRSDNNLIRIQSADIAENYLVEFEEMFLIHQFGPDSPANTPLCSVDLGRTMVEVYFSPDDGTMERVLELIRDIEERVFFYGLFFHGR